MNTSGATVKLGLDDDSLVQKSKRSKRALEDVAKGGDAVSRSLDKGVRSLRQMVGAAAAIGASLRAAQAVAGEMDAFIDRQAEASKSHGDVAVRLAEAIRKTGNFGAQGVDNAQAMVLGARGGATTDERLVLAEAIAEAGLTGSAASRTLAAGARGGEAVFGKGFKGLIEGAKYGQIPTDADVEARVAALPKMTRDELKTRERIRGDELRQMESGGGPLGRYTRIADAYLETRDLENPGLAAFTKWARALPGVKQLDRTDALRDRLLPELQKQTEILRSEQQGKINYSAAGGEK